MHKVYLLDADLEAFQSLILPHDDSFLDLVQRFDGTPLAQAWSSMEIEHNHDSPQAAEDFPSLLPHMPVFSERAVEVLSSMLTPFGQLIPIRCADVPYYLYNVTNLVHALNLDASDLVTFPGGRVMQVRKYVLNEAGLSSTPIFKLPEVPLLDVFVTDEFVKVVEDAGLRGFVFKPITVV